MQAGAANSVRPTSGQLSQTQQKITDAQNRLDKFINAGETLLSARNTPRAQTEVQTDQKQLTEEQQAEASDFKENIEISLGGITDASSPSDVRKLESAIKFLANALENLEALSELIGESSGSNDDIEQAKEQVQQGIDDTQQLQNHVVNTERDAILKEQASKFEAAKPQLVDEDGTPVNENGSYGDDLDDPLTTLMLANKGKLDSDQNAGRLINNDSPSRAGTGESVNNSQHARKLKALRNSITRSSMNS